MQSEIRLVVVVVLLVTVASFSQPLGVTDSEIVLGQSCALTGPAQALGLGMRDGLQACFDEVNAKGGIQGRRIRLISKDDRYEPHLAFENTAALLKQDNVFLLVGQVGTPTAVRVLPLVEETKVPFLGAFTGAEALRHPYRENIVNLRGSYYQETEMLAAYLIDAKRFKRVACFYQNDEYGRTGLEGMRQALRRRGMKLIETAHYKRNTMAVRTGLLAIRRSEPQAIVTIGAYQPCATFIRLAKDLGMTDVLYSCVSFVDSDALCEELGDQGEGCIVTQVVACPQDTSLPLVKEYQTAMRTYRPQTPIGYVSLEGYMVGKLFCAIAEKTGPDLSRASFLATLKTIQQFDLGGVVLTYGPYDNQGMDTVYLTQIHDGKVKPVEISVAVNN